MNDRPYDITSVQSIKSYADRLTGKSLASVVNDLPQNAYTKSNKGGLGSMVETYFFRHDPGNREHVPDFEVAGLELKVTGVLRRIPKPPMKSPYKAKERLVLSMISYMGLADEEWENSSLMKKCQLMLILFYLYEKDIPISDVKFVLPPLLWTFPQADLEIIENDWRIIQGKILDGKAHELSEGDTFYLSACRKGSGGPNEVLREQPYSDVLAKSRAFSLKPSYVNVMIEAAHNNVYESKLIESVNDAEEGIEKVTLDKFEGLQGKSVDDLVKLYDLPQNISKAKGYYHQLTMRILGTKKKYIPEFQKAGIILKTIRLQNNGVPKESMSFPAFSFKEVATQRWEDSDLFETFNHKFLFIVYQYDEVGVLRFKKAQFWNMPYQDMIHAESAWTDTKDAINAGNPHDFPKSSTNPVVHVRPHGRNADDKLELPGGMMYPKQGFWLNSRYIAEQVR